jgi:hypothetical protein
MKSERQCDRRSVAIEIAIATLVATLSTIAADLVVKLL